MCFELVERRKVKTQHLVPGSFRVGVNPEKRAKTKKLLLFALTCCVATFAVCGKKGKAGGRNKVRQPQCCKKDDPKSLQVHANGGGFRIKKKKI